MLSTLTNVLFLLMITIDERGSTLEMRNCTRCQSNSGLCGDRLYDASLHICCLGVRHMRVNHNGHVLECCGDSYINPLRDRCCGDKPIRHADKLLKCCNNSIVYDSSDVICDDGRLQRTSLACGSVPININETCCENKIFKTSGTPINGGRCCGYDEDVVAFNPDYEVCCAGKTYPKSQGCPESNPTKLYVSNVRGSDTSTSCSLQTPCKTINHAVQLAKYGAIIHVDGTNTEQSPYYECQRDPETNEYTGIKIRNSVHIVGVNGTAAIDGRSKCTVIDIVGTKQTRRARSPMEVSLIGLNITGGFSKNIDVGGAINTKDTSVNVNRCNLQNSTGKHTNYAFRYSQKLALGNMKYKVIISDSKFIHNDGGLYIHLNEKNQSIDSVELSIMNSEFSHNTGGALNIKIDKILNITGIFKDILFLDNKYKRGAGVSIIETDNGNDAQCELSDKELKFLNGRSFEEMTDPSYSPSNYVDTNTLRKYSICKDATKSKTIQFYFENTHFVANIATSHGGAVLSQFESANSTLQFKNVIFSENQASGPSAFGGGIYIYGGKVDILSCTFSDNSAAFLGGSIYMDSAEGEVRLDRCILTTTKTLASRGELVYSVFKGSFTAVNTVFSALTNQHEVNVFEHGSRFNYCLDTSSSVVCNHGYNIRLTDQFNVNQYSLIYTCQPCESGKYSLQQGYSNGSNPNEIDCIKCPPGGDCSTSAVRARSNFWGYQHDSTLDFILCPPGYCCHGNRGYTCDSYQTCHGHRNGILCGTCKDGFSQSIVHPECIATENCEQNSSVFWFLLVAVICMFSVAFYILCRWKLKCNIQWILKNRMCHKKVKNKNVSNEFEETEEMLDSNTVNRECSIQDSSSSRNSNKSCDISTIEKTGDHIYLISFIKILFIFYQIVALIASPRHRKYTALQYISFIINLFSFKISPDFKDTCLMFLDNHIDKTLFMELCVLLPIIAAQLILYFIFTCVELLLKKKSSNGNKCVNIKSGIAGAFTLTIILGYISILRVTFMLLDCVNINSQLRMYYSGNLLCFGPWWYSAVIFAFIFSVPFIAVPVMTQWKIKEEKFGFKFFAVMCMLPLPYSIYALISRCCNKKKRDPNSMNESDSEDNSYTEVVDITCVDTYSQSTNQLNASSVLFVLQSNYSPRSFVTRHWETVMLAVRLILVICHIFLHNEFIRTLILVSICAGLLFLHAYCIPYNSNKLQWYQSITFIILVAVGLLNVVDAFCYSYGESECIAGTNILNIIEVGQILLALVPLIIMIGLMFHKLVNCITDRLTTKYQRLRDVGQMSSQEFACNDASEEPSTRVISDVIRTPECRRKHTRPRRGIHDSIDKEGNSEISTSDVEGTSVSDQPILLMSPAQSSVCIMDERHTPVKSNTHIPVNTIPTVNSGGAAAYDASASQKSLLQKVEENVYLKACLTQLERILQTADCPAVLSSTNFTTSVFAAGVFNYEGGHLTLEQAGVNLFIPPDALSQDDGTQQFYIYISDIDSEYPRMRPGETALTPIVRCGPTGFRFQKHVLLSFKNCLDSEHNAPLKLWRSLSEMNQSTAWHDSSEGKETLCISQGTDCIAFINQLAMYSVVSSVDSCMYVINIFITRVNQKFMKIRARLSRDTPADNEMVTLKETSIGSYKSRDECKVVLSKTDGDYSIELCDLNHAGWKLVDGEPMKTIQNGAVWMNTNGGGPSPAVTYVLRHTNNHLQSISGCVHVIKTHSHMRIATVNFNEDLSLA